MSDRDLTTVAPPGWDELAERVTGRTALLTGPPGCGKSTLARWLAARTGSALVSADPGQPQVGVPTCLASSFDGGATASALWFVGGTKPSGNLLPMAIGAGRLAEEARSRQGPGAIVDTSGRVDGPAARVLHYHEAIAARVEVAVVLGEDGDTAADLLAAVLAGVCPVERLPPFPLARERAPDERRAYRERLINGDHFQSSPGRVEFTEGDNVAQVTPDASGWTATGIIVTVPSSGDDGAFTVPGTVSVSVVTSGGTSNEIALDLVTTPSFQVQNVEWTTTVSLPTALRGLAAVPVPDDSGGAFALVIGGNDGTDNVADVLTNTLAASGEVGASWTATTSLPASRAHHGAAVARPGNAPVGDDARFVYVIGGQENAGAAPGSSAKVFVASVSPADGTAGSWTETEPLPESLVGPAVTLYNGYVYVVGGLESDGTPSDDVYSAPVNSDGTLGSWTTAANVHPAAVGFATAFAFGGHLYVLGGNTGSSTDPNSQSSVGSTGARFARAWNGDVGTWSSTSSMVKQRQKHLVWVSFGQVLAAEGVYEGSPGSLELERSKVQSDGTLASWNGITATTNQPGANVYNAGSFVSPIRPSGSGPRFLLIGGQEFTGTPPGALSSAVYYNTAP